MNSLKYYDIHTHHRKGKPCLKEIYNIVAGKEKPLQDDWFSVGIHPWFLSEEFLPILDSFANQDNCLAIGECGLDFMPQRILHHNIAEQTRFFLYQVALAERLHKPLIIHCVKCFDKILQFKKQQNPTVPWIIHGYQKGFALAQQLVDAGFYLSFGAALFTHSQNAQALKSIPLEKVFFETDDQKKYDITAVYRQAAQILQVPLDSLQQQITLNFKKVFNPA